MSKNVKGNQKSVKSDGKPKVSEEVMGNHRRAKKWLGTKREQEWWETKREQRIGGKQKVSKRVVETIGERKSKWMIKLSKKMVGHQH